MSKPPDNLSELSEEDAPLRNALSILEELHANATPEVVRDVLHRFLAAAVEAGSVDRALLRDAAQKALKHAGIRRARELIDAVFEEVEQRAGDEDSRVGIALETPEPWPEPVDGADLLDRIVDEIRAYIVLTADAARAIALWVVLAHAFDEFSVLPLLVLRSPEKRCGKSNLLTIISYLVPRPLPSSNVSAAAIFRIIEAARPTLLIDETDSFLPTKDEIRGIINSGHTKGLAFVLRVEAVGKSFEVKKFSTWCPKALAGIGTLADTLRDRSIEIEMRRKTLDEPTRRVETTKLDYLQLIGRQIARWIQDHRNELRAADPEVPSEIQSDRARDNWRPLLAIADVAGGDWPERARDAARRLSGVDNDGSERVLLLGDLRDLFDRRREDRLKSRDILDALNKMDDRPWPEHNHGKGLNGRKLAELLKPFDIHPALMRSGPESNPDKGYSRASMEDAFRRYLPARLLRLQGSKQTTSASEVGLQGSQDVTDGEEAKSNDLKDVTDVTDPEGPKEPQY